MASVRSPVVVGLPQRVALVTDWFLPRLGGIELHLADLARALQARGLEVQVLTTTPGPAMADGIAVRRLPSVLAPGFDLALSLRLVDRLRHELTLSPVDIVHAHISVISPVGYAAILAARSLGLPAVATFHSVLLGGSHVLKAADRLIGWSRWPIVVSAVSRLVAGQLSRGIPGLEVDVLPNGVDPSQWRRTIPAAGSRNGGITAITAMRLYRKKRGFALLRALRTARDLTGESRKLALRIAGDGPELPALQHYVRRHRLQSEVEFLGRRSRPQLAALYGEADLFVMPSIRESFGLAALEARCAGLPVVAMRASGAAEFLRHGETALLADSDAEFARHWARLALDDDLRRRLAPPDAALDRYAWPLVAEAHLASYSRAAGLIGSPPGRTSITK